MNLETKSEKNIIFLLLLILLLIFIQGFLCRPSIGVSLHLECHLDFYDNQWNKIDPPIFCKYGFCSRGIFNTFWLENGFVETLQTLTLVIAIFFLIKTRNKLSSIKLFNYFLFIKIIALIYYLGEEISWGQHFVNWSSPQWFLENNNQKETNIHNVSNLLDQLPRSLVILWCAFIPLIINYLQNFARINEKLLIIILPSKKLIIFSILILIFLLPDLIVDKFGIHPKEQNIFDKEDGYFFDMITFNFLKLSEFQELLFCYYFLFYSIFINKFKLKDINAQEIQ